MTYYGRWTYKFEEAARKGAAAALIVHDDAGASYGWDVVELVVRRAVRLRASDDPAPRLPVQGWITGEAGESVVRRRGARLRRVARRRQQARLQGGAAGCEGVGDAGQHDHEKRRATWSRSLPGTQRPDEAIVYMAHWDHLGKHPDEPGDNIYNGAIDNATGVPASSRSPSEFAQAAAEAVGAVPRGDAGGIGPARLEVLRRASGRAAEGHGRGDQHRCDVDVGSVEGHGGDGARQLRTR
jgi:hypothetical protein